MEDLIRQAQKGNKEAFTKIIYQIQHDLYKIARCRLSCEADIEDAIQETIIEIYKSIRKLKKMESYKKWIFTILINRCNQIYKKNKGRNISFEDLENICYSNAMYSELEKEDFYFILKDLNYDERIALILFYLEDYSIKEISSILKTNENTIKTRLKRGKEKIRNKILKGNK